MSVFSDEDLKRLKEYMEGATMPLSRRVSLRALLARMEASEKLAEHHSGHDEDCGELEGEKCSCGYAKADDLWLKSCGRDR